MDPFDKPWLKLAVKAPAKPAVPKGKITSARIRGSLLTFIHDVPFVKFSNGSLQLVVHSGALIFCCLKVITPEEVCTVLLLLIK